MVKKGNRGFTLIELLVVIAIIGILSSVVLASLNTARRKARDSRRVSDIQQIQLALELYFDSCRAYPIESTGNTLSTATKNSDVTGTDCASTFGSFMSEVPVPPAGGTESQYVYNQLTNTTYCLGITMESADAVPDGDSVGTTCGSITSNTNTDAEYVVHQ